MIGLRSLVLNANYMPISIFPLQTIPVEDAITRVFNNKYQVVFDYPRKILHPNLDMNWPAIVARTRTTNIKQGVRFARDNVYYRDHGLCQYCESKIELQSSTYDHVIPRSKGGLHVWENVVTSCRNCNNAKGNRLPKDSFVPKRMPYKPTYWELAAARKLFPILIDHESWREFLPDWQGDIILKSI